MFDLTPPRFVKKLYSIVESPECPFVKWGEDGASFLITDKPLFVRETLSKICRTDDYSTFIRQLNNYGFTKIKSDLPHTDEFSNPKFVRGSPELLAAIRRKSAPEEKGLETELGAIRQDQSILQNNIIHLDGVNRKLLNELYFLKEKVELQERTINELVRAFLSVFKSRGLEQERMQIGGAGALDKVQLDDLLKSKEGSLKNRGDELEDLSDFLEMEYDNKQG